MDKFPLDALIFPLETERPLLTTIFPVTLILFVLTLPLTSNIYPDVIEFFPILTPLTKYANNPVSITVCPADLRIRLSYPYVVS